ncbi:MAG: hypothetical protein CL693_14855 [Cellvibrionaceae bacterium]|nr:hypothetical protein [Cellvibrionaceae bacterium]|tara:strand:- start:2151 stop:2441 length:291 start_codon:yes stop_codon:yes gene_type:complete
MLSLSSLKVSTLVTTSALLLASLLAPSLSVANSEPSQLNPRDIVDDYRQLRISCAQREGQDRRQCFSELHQQTEQYQNAKERLKSAQMLGLRLTSR